MLVTFILAAIFNTLMAVILCTLFLCAICRTSNTEAWEGMRKRTCTRQGRAESSTLVLTNTGTFSRETATLQQHHRGGVNSIITLTSLPSLFPAMPAWILFLIQKTEDTLASRSDQGGWTRAARAASPPGRLDQQAQVEGFPSPRLPERS